MINKIIYIVRYIFLKFYLRYSLLKHYKTFYRFVEIILYQFILIFLLFNLRIFRSKYFSFLFSRHNLYKSFENL